MTFILPPKSKPLSPALGGRRLTSPYFPILGPYNRIMLGARNTIALTQYEVKRCRMMWAVLSGKDPVELDCSSADQHGSQTRFIEDPLKVILGADAYPGNGSGANSRLSTLACLVHELARVRRFKLGIQRAPGNLIDEAETSLDASFASVTT